MIIAVDVTLEDIFEIDKAGGDVWITLRSIQHWVLILFASM